MFFLCSSGSISTTAIFASLAKYSYLYPVDGGFSADRNQWVEILSNEVSLAISQKKNAKDALNDAVNQINASRS